VPNHNLHKLIGKTLLELQSNTLTLLLDPACGGDHNIPLFITDEKSNSTEICNVDAIIICNDKIKLIIEIEETNVKPTQILGKMMTSALTKYYIHKTNNNNPIEMDDETCFIQILNTGKLKKGLSSKEAQWDNLKNAVSHILPVKDSKLCSYEIFYGDSENINLENIKSHIINVLEKNN
jgi:hypothetical protein